MTPLFCTKILQKKYKPFERIVRDRRINHVPLFPSLYRSHVSYTSLKLPEIKNTEFAVSPKNTLAI